MQSKTLPAMLILSASALLSSCAPADALVTPVGYQGVRTGMSVSEAEREIGLELVAVPPVTPEMEACHYVFPGGETGRYAFMVVDGRIARVDIDQRGILTGAGIGIGADESAVKAAYPEAQTLPHKYTDGHYLLAEQADGHGFVFETDGQRVTRYRAGRLPEVRWVEGCS